MTLIGKWRIVGVGSEREITTILFDSFRAGLGDFELVNFAISAYSEKNISVL